MKKVFGLLVIFLLCSNSILYADESPQGGLMAQIKLSTYVDLTHTFSPDIPHWPGFDKETVTTEYHYDKGVGRKGAGFLAQTYCHVGQWGTHVDPPAHFVKGKRFADEIEIKEMVLPLVVIDVSAKVLKNPDYTISMQDVKRWEDRNGLVPEGSFVAMRTDWSKRWPSQDAMMNRDKDGVAHYPGWSQEVLSYLYEVRNVTASGHETTDTDPGSATSKGHYTLETYILSLDHYQIEMLTNLDRVPESGAVVVATWPKPFQGSGFPARVFALIPKVLSNSESQ